jgi:glycolate oxidase iron-sulfur subunit
VQKSHLATRTALGAAYGLVELDDEGLCCGAGGAYALYQPELSNEIRARKVDAIRRAGGDDPIVASANPGCAFHLQAGGLDVRHPADLLAEALHDE